MPKTKISKVRKRQGANDIMHSLRELARTVEEGVPLERRFTVRTIAIPEPGNYSPRAVKYCDMNLA